MYRKIFHHFSSKSDTRERRTKRPRGPTFFFWLWTWGEGEIWLLAYFSSYRGWKIIFSTSVMRHSQDFSVVERQKKTIFLASKHRWGTLSPSLRESSYDIHTHAECIRIYPRFNKSMETRTRWDTDFVLIR